MPCQTLRTCITVSLPVALLLAAGCATQYVTPGGAADLGVFGGDAGRAALTDVSVQERLARKPLATFPSNLAVARVQAPGYHSYSVSSAGRGNYSVVTARDVETDEDLQRLRRLPQVADIAAMNRLLFPERLQDDLELRQAAASLQAEILLIYTFDTTFRIANTAEPLGILTLGLFPSREARVETTVSALFMDTRSGYIYGLAEASARDDEVANPWTSLDAVDATRRRVEREAFDALMNQVEGVWDAVVRRHAPPPADSGQPAGGA